MAAAEAASRAIDRVEIPEAPNQHDPVYTASYNSSGGTVGKML